MNARQVPEFGARRLLVVGSGAISVMQLPFWLTWLTSSYPELEVEVVLTRSAEQFVSSHALSVLVGRETISDRWPAEPQAQALHVRLTEWSDSVIVYPACMNFVSRLALGLADTPALLALQCTPSPIAVAPSLPPGALRNPTFTGHLKSLEERPNVVVAPTQAATSATTGRKDAAGAPPLWKVIELVEGLRRDLAAETAGDEAPGPTT
ncbi:flavoprotein [Sinosporangium siamense]|uniref:Phosphopantothenoylcysteine synthetase n=1 Tax=Sinosporangium siamense TaxID=1367973 RepID=A0A919RDB5_9ACTN|nr:flavoprotein [Sinosporangium siamense]GII90665.1 phosphopantothenoylcysteine synthetase [Sinosporangium siamense]